MIACIVLIGGGLFITGVLTDKNYGFIRDEPEIRAKFYDANYEEDFVQALAKNEIPHRRDEKGIIYYSTKYKDQVESLKKSVNSNIPVIFEMFDMSMLKKFEEYLNSRDVEFQKSGIENGFVVIVNKKDTSNATEAWKLARQALSDVHKP